jgi:WhiB family redox-sensing transcriptional regulator
MGAGVGGPYGRNHTKSRHDPATDEDSDMDWTTRARCRTTDPDELFVQGAAQNRAKQVCLGCPVRTECLADALDNRVEFGVWGGMTERERRALLRRRPDVKSWATLLQTARQDYEKRPFAGVAG